MNNLKLSVLLLGLLTLTYNYNLTLNSLNGDFSSFDTVSSSIPLSDLTSIANYYGCKTWNKNTCTECSGGYFFNSNGICCQVDPVCSKFNQAVGVCEGCYQGYAVVNGKCSASAIDNGCVIFNGATCTKCSQRWYFNSANVCTPVSDLCYTWNAQGACLSCFGGYLLNNGACSINSQPFTPGSNSLCQTWVGTTCTACSFRAYFDSNGVCQQVDSQCQTWDSKSGLCLTCFGGYALTNGKCLSAAINHAQPSDLGCSLWNWNQQVCLQCSSRWYFSNSMCVPVSDLCNTYNQQGNCLSCYSGYDLNNGICSLSNKNSQPTDIGCALWDWNNQICLQCSQNWVFSSNKKCVTVSDQCATFNANGACTACFNGYSLNNGICSLNPTQQVTDLGCALWDWNKQLCLQCSQNWVFINSKCTPVADQCATSDQSGACLSCYSGYLLSNGKCSLAPTKQVSDLGCALWDWNNQVCLQCSQNWVFINSKCTPVSDQCASFDKNSGACSSCYSGYVLSNGKCSLAPTKQVTDLGCALWDWKNQVCLQCSQNWVFNSNKQCIPVSDQCASFDSQGNCLTCYIGYNLANGKCNLAPVQQVTDLGCALWDWKNQICLQCSNRFYFNLNKKCVPVNDNCQTADANGVCQACYNGYNLNNGNCQLANSLCRGSNSNGACTDCYSGYILYQGSCTPISKLANLALYYAACCPEKLATLNNITSSTTAASSTASTSATASSASSNSNFGY